MKEDFHSLSTMIGRVHSRERLKGNSGTRIVGSIELSQRRWPHLGWLLLYSLCQRSDTFVQLATCYSTPCPEPLPSGSLFAHLSQLLCAWAG